MSEELTETDYNICIMAVMKCQILRKYSESGLPITLDDKSFGFAKMSDEEESALIAKLHSASQVAWLKEQKEKSG
jgi:hypothetical protein